MIYNLHLFHFIPQLVAGPIERASSFYFILFKENYFIYFIGIKINFMGAL